MQICDSLVLSCETTAQNLYVCLSVYLCLGGIRKPPSNTSSYNLIPRYAYLIDCNYAVCLSCIHLYQHKNSAFIWKACKIVKGMNNNIVI
jgi:hypothetical protein